MCVCVGGGGMHASVFLLQNKRERERERERQTDRQKGRETEIVDYT